MADLVRKDRGHLLFSRKAHDALEIRLNESLRQVH